MSVRIGHASRPEGRGVNGAAGDQTGKEVCVRDWYNMNADFVAIHPDANVREKHAKACEAGCRNNNIGYSQFGTDNRNTLNTLAKAVNYDLSKITKKCNADCSAFQNVCAVASGAKGVTYGSNGWTTSTMKAALKAAGYIIITGKKYLQSADYCVRGAIYVKASSHTVCGLDNGAKASQTLKAAGITSAGAAEPTTSGTGMKLSSAGLKLIKNFEGCRLKAYKDIGGVLTIGYGHTSGVTSGMTITQAQADEFLKADCRNAEKAVYSYFNTYRWTQNQFDALVSFTFNCGSGNLKKLLDGGRRSIAEISESIPKYNKAKGVVLNGLVRRRAAEKEMFDGVAGQTSNASGTQQAAGASVKLDAAQSREKSLSGTYKVTAKDGLRLRAGAGTSKSIITTMPHGSTVQCYGYYTSVSGVKWLYVVYKGQTGFASSEYLRK